MIRTCALQSGSNGNCFYVETPDTRLIIDAGISGKAAADRLLHLDRNIRDVHALLISHNHSDHIRAAGTLHRRLRCPLYMTRGTADVAAPALGKLHDLRCFEPADTITIRDTRIETVPTAHDGVAPVAFIISHADLRLGIFTDLGHCFPGLADWLNSLDALYLESNYDPHLLETGPYPEQLKARIRGRPGHISNAQAAQLLQPAAASRLRFAVLSHLSEKNNLPDLAYQTARDCLEPGFALHLASRYAPTPMFYVE